MLEKFKEWLHKERYYQVGFINPKTLSQQETEGIRISYQHDRKRNMTFKKDYPLEKAIQKFVTKNEWIFDGKNRYTYGLDKLDCIKVITEENVQIHPLYRKKAKITNANGVIQVKENDVDDGWIYCRGYFKKIKE